MPTDAASLLDARGVDAGYGTMQVLWGVDLDVRPGETVLLLGANGAGKSTLLKSIAGAERPRAGTVTFDGTRIDGQPQHVITAGGIAPVPLRLEASEAALQGKPATAATIAQAAELATSGAKPLPMTGYKLELLTGLVRDVMERIAT